MLDNSWELLDPIADEEGRRLYDSVLLLKIIIDKVALILLDDDCILLDFRAEESGLAEDV